MYASRVGWNEWNGILEITGATEYFVFESSLISRKYIPPHNELLFVFCCLFQNDRSVDLATLLPSDISILPLASMHIAHTNFDLLFYHEIGDSDHRHNDEI